MKCRGMRWLDIRELPTMAPHPMTLAASDGVHDVFVEIETEKNGHWGWASNDPARRSDPTPRGSTAKRAAEKGHAAILSKYGPYTP